MVEGAVAFDEDQVLEVEQRVGKRDLAAEPADVVVQRPPRVGVGDGRVGDGLLELRQRRVEGGEARRPANCFRSASSAAVRRSTMSAGSRSLSSTSDALWNVCLAISSAVERSVGT